MARKRIFKTSVMTVTSTSIAEPLFGSTTLVFSATIQATVGNTSNINIRDSINGSDGLTLTPGQVIELEPEFRGEKVDLSNFWVDVGTASDGASITYWI